MFQNDCFGLYHQIYLYTCQSYIYSTISLDYSFSSKKKTVSRCLLEDQERKYQTEIKLIKTNNEQTIIILQQEKKYNIELQNDMKKITTKNEEMKDQERVMKRTAGDMERDTQKLQESIQSLKQNILNLHTEMNENLSVTVSFFLSLFLNKFLLVKCFFYVLTFIEK